MKTSNKILLTILITFLVTAMLITAALRINSTKVKLFIPENNATSISSTATDKNTNQKEIALASFNGVEIGGFYNIEIKKSDQSKIILHGDDNVLKILDVSVNNNILRIDTPKDFNWMNQKPVDLTIFTNDLNTVSIGGSVTLKDMDVDSNSLEVNVGGRTNCTFAGKAKIFALNLGGNSMINAKGLVAENVNINLAGKNYITVNASDSLQISGVGNNEVFYAGNPKNVINNSIGWNKISQLQ